MQLIIFLKLQCQEVADSLANTLACSKMLEFLDGYRLRWTKGEAGIAVLFTEDMKLTMTKKETL